jgi:hypothetical protein
MARAPWTDEALYEAAQRFVERCLARDGSLFTPDEPVWTLGVVNEAAARLLVDDTRKLGYMEKLKDQVEGLSARAVQFTAEILFIELLPIGDTGAAKKREVVEEILGWMPEPVALPPDLIRVLDFGVASYGPGKAQRDRYVKYLVRFAVAWKQAPEDERRAALDDAWIFRDFVYRHVPDAVMQREALLHLVFPDTFEHALAPDDKAKIVKAFSSLEDVETAANDDRALLVVREAVKPIHGERFSPYDGPFKPLWDEAQSPEWDGLTHWAARLYDMPEFDKEERTDKLAVAESLSDARDALAGDGDWFESLKRALRARINNLTPWQTTDSFLKWCECEPDAARVLLTRLWSSDGPDVAGFLDDLPEDAVATDGARIALASVLLGAIDVTRYPFFRATPFDRASSLLGRDTSGLRAATRYDAFVSLPRMAPDLAYRYLFDRKSFYR